jgi:metal-responsive CopG/Arc/MetJ family transcriptional regulator
MKAIKTAVSLPAEVYAQAEKLRKKLGKSRSEMMADGLRVLLKRHDLREREKRDAAAWRANPETDEEIAEANQHAARAWAELDDEDWGKLLEKK